jgi:hypothetical protein
MEVFMSSSFSNVTVYCSVFDEDVKNEVLRLFKDDLFEKRDGDVAFSDNDEMITIKNDVVYMELSACETYCYLNYFEFWDGEFDPILNCNCGYTSTKRHDDYLDLLSWIPRHMLAFLKFEDREPLETLLERAIAAHRVELAIYPYKENCFPKKIQEFEVDGTTLVYFKGGDGTSVIIPEGITEISKDAFALEKKRNYTLWPKFVQKLSRVETVSFPKSLVKIGDRAFYKCNLDGEIKLYSNLSSIGVSAFEENSIESVVLEEGIKKIDKLAFANMPTLTRAIIPASVKKIGDKAFSGCPNLTIHTTKGSYAEAYAVENDIKLELI